ncbi:hypothetical protein [Amycolatopsis benzoatilytica]|uniref:hypothetical protein n=1 Tax=Amycolatopsis benzoatilytica TaxID=346045 RepID=UPI00037FBB63|nr:hypothetical protein [Amycolatopsis benzoatilytica]
MSSLEEHAAVHSISLTEIVGKADFASDLVLAEYRTLRDEILKKMDHRTSMVVCSVTVSSAVLGFGIERKSAPLLLVSPLVSLLLGILILFHNVQIGAASEHLRTRVEQLVSKQIKGFVGWHQTMGDPKVRLIQRLLPYHLPLILIAIAPAGVAIPLALSKFGAAVQTVPVLTVVVLLLVLYAVQLVRHRDSI